jgi:hypothetical protein
VVRRGADGHDTATGGVDVARGPARGLACLRRMQGAHGSGRVPDMLCGRPTLGMAAAGGMGWQRQAGNGGSGAWAGTRGGLENFRSGMRSSAGTAVHRLGLLLSTTDNEPPRCRPLFTYDGLFVRS